MRFIKYFSISVLISAIFFYAFYNPNSIHTLTGQTFATFYTIKINSRKIPKDLQTKITHKLNEINSCMSAFDPSSEISKINRSPAQTWIDLSPEMTVLMKEARCIHHITNGTFDPTIGPLINLWGFGPNNFITIPDDLDIQQTLTFTGFEKVHFDNNFQKLMKPFSQTNFNLSAIAKGYGVDQIAELLLNEGLQNFIIEIGGEIRTSGSRSSNQSGWNIGIFNPLTKQTQFTIPLHNLSAATSGDYRNTRQNYAHIISPQTGYPISSTTTSVTIFDPVCMRADALATAIQAMPRVDAENFVEQHQISAIIYYHDTYDPFISTQAKELINASPRQSH